MSIHQPYSKLLIQDEPLQVLPALAVEVGLNEAIVLQQIHYWMNPRRNMGSIHEGKKWIYNTYEGWRENFPFWSLRTIQGIILKLEREELIESTDRFNTDTRDRTKWYTINYDHPILCAGDANSAHSMSTQDLHGGDANVAHSTIEQRIPTEKTSETSSERKSMPRHGMAQTLLAVLHEDVLHIPPPTNYGRAMKDADTLAKAGCTPDEILSIAQWLINDPFWGPKGVTINRILTKRDEWLAAQANTKKKIKRFVV